MKTFHVYDPALCCSTGVCGPDVDPALARFAGLVAQLTGAGVAVERFNLAQQPLRFVQHPGVKALLDTHGVASLPAIFIDGELTLHGRYPDSAEAAGWLARASRAS